MKVKTIGICKIKYLTFSTRQDEGLDELIRSWKRHNLDFHVIEGEWKGFGTKIIETYNYVKYLDNYTHFIFVDAYDVIFLGDPEPLIKYQDHVIISCEKACWPDATLESKYTDGGIWKYPNSGSYFAPIDLFIKIFDENPIEFKDDDQLWFHKVILRNDYKILRDTNCTIFQSIAFEEEGDFEYEGSFKNKKKDSYPVVIHGNGKTDMSKIKKLANLNSLQDIQDYWKDEEKTHKFIHETLIEKVNATPYLKAHRDWVEQNHWGFGERSFQWMWKCLIEEMPENFSFLEIGVFRGQILSLVGLLAEKQKKQSYRFGVTPLSPLGIGWESDYRKDIETIHDVFQIKKDYTLIPFDSTKSEAIEQASLRQYDIVFIDGGHDYETVKKDIKNYLPLVKEGGYLVIDDAACKTKQPFGYFQGIEDVCKAVDEVLPNKEFKELFNVVHNRVFKKWQITI